MIRPALFFLGTLFFLFFSRRSLLNPRVHGFYRFFVFEGILALILINHPHWFTNPFSPRQCLSWFLLAVSIFFVIQALILLKRRGGYAQREEAPENHAFENTIRVVEEGLYRHVRHPMYSSLLFLAWGAFAKQITPVTALLVGLTSAFIVAAARIEEKENIRFFGAAYTDYMQRSRSFIPWIF
jgi:protein-S-isoprenylcysteine O-methyltransferase Ste14